MLAHDEMRSHDTPVVDADGKPLRRSLRIPKTSHPPALQECGASLSVSQLPQPLERFPNPLDLLGAFLVFPAEVGGEGFGGGVGIGADELAEEGDLLGEAVGPGEERCWILNVGF